MLDFAPETEEDILNLLPEGEYDFLVKLAENWRSKTTGNQSIKLTLDVYDANGRAHLIYCFLSVKFMFLLKHFTDATGLEEAYQSGHLTAEMCNNQSGKCKVIIEQPAEGTNYLPKNTIKDFIKRDANAPKKQDIDPNLNDDLPF